MKRKQLSLLRIILSPLTFYFIWTNNTSMALGAFGIAILTAYLDAKSKQDTISSIIDSLADKALIVSLTLALWVTGQLSTLFMLIFVGRELVTLLGGISIILRHNKVIFTPNPLTNIVFFFELLGMGLILLNHPDKVIMTLAAILAPASLIYTFISEEFQIVPKGGIKLKTSLSLPDYITLLNATLGLIVIWLSSTQQHTLASLCLLLAVAADYADGKLARKLNKTSQLGKQLDSLADTISFGVAPAAFGFSLLQSPLAIIAFSIFLFCGIVRLARFNITTFDSVYEGMPITVNGVLIPAIYFFSLPLAYYPYIYFFSGALMVSNLTIRKIK